MQKTEFPPPTEPSAGERLDSWKEIGAYLKRDVRTLRRWEKDEGLPVHRHVHDKQATVYAYRAELDVWWNNRRPKLEAAEAKTGETRRRGKRWGVAGVAAGVAVVGLVALWSVRGPALPFKERDWVLIGSFENRAGEAVFEGTLEYALERELSNSHFVNVVPRERTNDMLQLMQKPLDTAIDRNVGREICLRDGGIRALIVGRVEKLDTTYILSAALVNPSSGVTVASFSEQAEGQNQVVSAVGQLAERVRRTLGEELANIESTHQRLAQVTTPSLRALHLFTRADAVIAKSEEGNVTAEQLLRQAIAEDPEFASAWMHLAFALRNQRRSPKEYQPYARQALVLSQKSSVRERYFILGAYHSMMGEHEKAVAAYRTLVQLYPNHYWGNNNLANWLPNLGRFKEAVPYKVKMAVLQPHDFGSNFSAGWALVAWADDPVAARPYLERARQLTPPGVPEGFASQLAWLELFPFYESWRQGRVQEAVAQINRVARRLSSLPQGAQGAYAWRLGGGYLTLGKLQAAEEMFHSISDKEGRAQGLAMVAWARGDGRAIREHLRSPAASFFNVMLLAAAGFPRQAQEAMNTPKTPSTRPGPTQEAGHRAALGQIALARGQTSEAIHLLEEGVRVLGGKILFLAADALAQSHEEQGEQLAALEVLEKISQEKKHIADSFEGGAFWMRAEWHRAQLLRGLGREREAGEIEAELRKLLAHADPDHFILLKVQPQERPAPRP